jgi:hypothetical protein
VKLLIWVSVLLSVFLILSANHPTLLRMPNTVGLDLSTDQAQSVGSGLRQIDLLTVIGAIIVFIFYWTKFGQWHGEEGAPPGFKPQPARHFTTWLRYSSWAGFYASIMVGCYLLIVLFPTIFLMIIGLLEKMSVHEDLSLGPNVLSTLQKTILINERNLNSAVLAPYALIVVILVWAGTCQKLERKARRKLQESALIPNEAQGLIYRLQQIETISESDFQPNRNHFEKALFFPDPDTLKKIMGKVPTLISEKEFRSMDEDYLAKFCQCLYFQDKLKDLRAESGSADIWRIYETELADVEQRLTMLQDDMERYREELVQALRYAKKIEKYESEHAELKIEVNNLSEMMNIRDIVNLNDLPLEELRRHSQEERIQCMEKINALQHKLDDQSNLSTMFRTEEDDLIAFDSLTLPQIKDIREKTSVKRLPFERRYFKNAEKRLENRVDQCFRILQQIIACGVLAVGKSYNRRMQLFDELNLKLPALTGIPLNRNFVFKAGLFIAAWMGLSTLAYAHFIIGGDTPAGHCSNFVVPSPSGFSGAVFWTTSAVIMHTLGIVAAYLVENALLIDQKRFPNGFTRNLINTDYMLAFMFGVALNIFFLSLLMAAGNRFAELAGRWQWTLVPGMTAYFTGYYISQSKRNVDPNRTLVFLQGALTALMAIIVLLWIWDASPLDMRALAECPDAYTFFWYCLVSTFIVGAVLSYLTQKVAVRKRDPSSTAYVSGRSE